MRILSRNEQEFHWEGIASTSRDKRRLYYKSFFLDDEKFSVEEYVLIRNDDSIDSEDISNCYVGRIKELYDTGDPYEPHQARVQWYSRVAELPPYTRKNFDQVHSCEVIEENRPHFSDTIDADTIFAKCEVHFLPPAADFESLNMVLGECDIPTFFCRYKFSGKKLAPKVKGEGSTTPGRRKEVLKGESSGTEKTSTTPMKNKTYVATATGTEAFPKVLIRRLDDSILEKASKPIPKAVDKLDVATGTEAFPKVLIKKLDDSVLEKANKPIPKAVDKFNVATVDSLAGSLEHNLCLCSPVKNSDKRPLIHSLSSTVPESLSLDMLTSVRSSPKKKTNADISIQAAPVFSSSIKTPPKKPEKLKKCTLSNSQICTPNKPVKIETCTPSAQCTARRQKDTPQPIKSILHTPSPRTSKKNTLKRISFMKTEIVSSPKSVPSVSCRRKTLKEAPETPSPNKRKMTPSQLASCSPSKSVKTARRSINFFENQEVVVTRSGRKTKSVNYFELEDFDNRCNEIQLSDVVKKGRLSRFLKSNYSDESGSEFSASSSSSDSEEDVSVSDSSLVEKKIQTPRSRKKTVPRNPKQLKNKNVDVCIPVRKTPLKAADNILEESRLRLHVSAVPTSLPCRTAEYSDIYSFVKGCLNAHTGGCMYISGVPGTGKTATVHEVIRNLEVEKEDGDIPLFTFVEVNGMWMTDPYQCYVHIFKSLTGKSIASQQAANMLEKRFTESGPKKEAVILLVDELDRLWTRKQTVMYNIFDWPSKKHSKLIVLAIANTMDLPERLMMNRISSRLGLTRKTFQPYTFRQLQEIIMSRIQELKVFDPDAVQFVARKVAAVSGDARRALDICRHATEVAEKTKSTPKKKSKVLVTMKHVDVAIQQMFSSPVIVAIKSCSKVAKLFLQGMLYEFTRTGSEETTLWKVSAWVANNYEGTKRLSSAAISNVCSQLAASHLILADNFQSDIYMKIRLSVSPDDVSYALTGRDLAH